MNIPSPSAWLSRGPMIRRCLLVLSPFLLILYHSDPSSATGLYGRPRACAFVFHRRGINHLGGGGRANSSSLDALPSFFERFRKGTKETEQQRQQELRLQTDVDLYRLLGVHRDAPASGIAARAEELQKQQREQFSGVDTPHLDPFVESLLREISATLQNPTQRAAYDEGGYVPESLSALLQELLPVLPSSSSHEENTSEEATATVDEEDDPEDEPRGPSSLFSALFGPHFLGSSSPFAAVTGGRRASRPQRGADVEASVTLGFEDAALKGASSLSVRVQRQEPCASCSSFQDHKALKPSACRACEGRGMQTETRRSSFGFVSTSISCPACGGTGESGHPACDSCGGEGLVNKEVSLKVNIPAGVSEGSLLRVEGEGSKSADGGQPGDIYISVNVEKHNRFSREGADVLSDETISLHDAVNGCKLTVETIDGTAEVEVPPLSRSGQKVIIRGRGARRLDGHSSKRGDHIITLRVALPDKITAEDRELLQRLRDAEKGGDK